MKIKYFLIIPLLLMLIISCSRDQVPEKMVQNDPLVAKIATAVLYPGAMPYHNAELMFYYTYDGNERLTKKIGGFLPVSGSTGLGGFFTDKIQTNLKYENDKVTVEDVSIDPDFTIPKNIKYFKLNSSNLILEKEIPHRSSAYWDKKQLYTYKNGMLDEITTTLPNMPYDPTDPNDYIITYSEKFFYDGSKNLIRTEYFELQNGVKNGEKIIRFFENYDNSYNPFKRFTLLDEYFYRSLSQNNFRNYKEEKTESGITNVSQQEWGFNYDTSGQIIIK